MKFSRTYYDLKEFIQTDKRICVNQGGSRSGKTYSILQFLIETAIVSYQKRMKGMHITVCRKTFPSLRTSAMKDFFDILNKIGWYNESNHNMSSHEYILGNSTFEFISVDQPQKIRGVKRDILYCNEINELRLEDWRQLMLRTTDRVFIDYNPSDEFSFIYDNILTREDVLFYITTYKDNPFLRQWQIDEIESYKNTDENYWKVFGLGQRGASGATIYTHWNLCEALPENYIDADYGLDFGYNAPTALTKCVRTDAGLFARQTIYQSRLTNNDLIQLMNSVISVSDKRNLFIECDGAEPDRIQELQRAGFRARPAKKEVKLGIDKVKSVPLFITKDSTELLKEIKGYKWKVDHNEKPTDTPVPVNDHAMDSLRYGAFPLIVDRKIKARVAELI
jgi:phage terminase large subunit